MKSEPFRHQLSFPRSFSRSISLTVVLSVRSIGGVRVGLSLERLCLPHLLLWFLLHYTKTHVLFSTSRNLHTLTHSSHVACVDRRVKQFNVMTKNGKLFKIVENTFFFFFAYNDSIIRPPPQTRTFSNHVSFAVKSIYFL